MRNESDRTRAIVESFYRDYAGGKGPERAAESFAYNIDFEICVPSYLFEFAGARRGIGPAIDALRAVAEKYEILSLEPHMTIVEGENACVHSTMTVRSRAGGAEVSVETCDLLRLRDGKIVWFREFFDTATAAAGIFGGPARSV